MDRMTRFQPLGTRRNLLLDCLGGHTPQAPGFLDPPEGTDVVAAFAAHVEELSGNAVFQSDPLTALLLAAGRLLAGELRGADTILRGLPAEAPGRMWGQRYCPLMPFRVLGAVLPLPPGLGDAERWTAGSPEQEAAVAWLAAERGRLRWVEPAAEYVLAG